MRAFIVVFVIVLAVIFVGGAFNLGGAPIFGHIDRLLRTHMLMSLHYSVFFFLYRGEDTVETGLSRTKGEMEEFQDRPLGFDKKKTYKKLDEAAGE